MSDAEKSYDYVIVGAGVAAASAVKGIRSEDGSGSIAVLGSEPDEPVYRPVLSKDLWLKDDETLEGSSLAGDLKDDDAVDLLLDTTVTGIDTDAHVVRLADGSTVGYGKLLLATGAEPRVLGVDPGPRVVYYRTAADYRRLRAVAAKGSHVAVVGGGYIGSEIASALVQNGVDVTLVLDLEDVQEQMFPRALAAHLTKSFDDHGVTIVHGSVAGGEEDDGGVRIRLDDDSHIVADAAVIGVGVLPRTGLAEAAGLEVDNGIVVDVHLRTSNEDVYAAGDVAAYPDALLGRRRVEHVDHAEKSGELAGRAMAGASDTYDYTPFFWSDIFDHGYEAVGETSSRLDMVEDWKDGAIGTGVVYYLRSGQVRGVLLWNVWDSVDQARELMAETAKDPVADPGTLRGRIPFE
ncbi:NADPH-dependent 2,4-dienoyl-CoA reductase/sulfur reductase-like enzyme [Nocardioides cavernae]|uniref:NADPH-dependent 2,4-dienoyl-CoA reductase/sulfur reductase-like enzyme n=1 Tax=Nocardioides cavernae TaxID=1921566 RepID=A0A7Y9H0S8_9ACTN|nr:FAD/NAD(P)-binding oxidoreductase [Nocardioides cavernae]NYE35673.1 NADPH-dependent 2,4-dienoyl-CoA reductase/sulfur reductase-like enzyme [Nocardioides cavernae]